MDVAIRNIDIDLKIKWLRRQSRAIVETTRALTKIKRDIITKLEETKQTIRMFTSMRNLAGEEIKPSILNREQTVSLLDVMHEVGSEAQALIGEMKKEFLRGQSSLVLEVLDGDFDIPEDISHIQNLHDVVVHDLDALKKSLDSHVAIVEKTELIMNILNYKLYEIQYIFRTQLDKLQKKKENLIKVAGSGQESNAALQIIEVDDEISVLEQNQQKELDCVKEQKIDAQKAYETACQTMDHNFQKMSMGFNKLLLLIEAEKSTLGASQSKLVDSKFFTEVDTFRNNIEKFTELQTTGWKIMYPEEKISELLHQHGLKILHSGILITEEGQTITFKQAKAKLIDDMSPQALEQLKANIQNGDDTSASSKSDISTGSKMMASEDVNYLKECLGKPLTLAVAEITAVQPRDPIHYLGHWLFKYRYNQQMEDVNSIDFEILNDRRAKLAKERWHQFIEEEARAAVIDMIVHAEEIGMMNELKRIQEEANAMEEMENYDDEARDTLGTYNGPPTGQLPL